MFACLLLSCAGVAQTVDFSGAAIFLTEKKNIYLQKAAEVLQDEIHKRSGISLPVIYKPSSEYLKVIFVGVEERMEKLPESVRIDVRKLPATGKEGYKIISFENKTVVIAGHDEAGALYGVGWLLRKMELLNNKILVPQKINLSSTPASPIRGHQLGYRPKTNAYDAWSVASMTHISGILSYLEPTALK